MHNATDTSPLNSSVNKLLKNCSAVGVQSLIGVALAAHSIWNSVFRSTFEQIKHSLLKRNRSECQCCPAPMEGMTGDESWSSFLISFLTASIVIVQSHWRNQKGKPKNKKVVDFYKHNDTNNCRMVDVWSVHPRALWNLYCFSWFWSSHLFCNLQKW